jgi:hypothetical protein
VQALQAQLLLKMQDALREFLEELAVLNLGNELPATVHPDDLVAMLFDPLCRCRQLRRVGLRLSAGGTLQLGDASTGRCKLGEYIIASLDEIKRGVEQPALGNAGGVELLQPG